MSEFLPIEIRHLDKTTLPLSSYDLIPIVVGSDDSGYETRATKLLDIKDYINVENQDFFIDTLNVNNSAVIQNYLNVGEIYSNTGNKLYVDGNVLISGSLSALSGITYFNTTVSEASSLFLSGSNGNVLTVKQEFNFPIAQFFDGNQISLHIDGRDATAANVGIKTDNPNESLTVSGNISSDNYIFSPFANINTVSSNNLISTNLNIYGNSNIGDNNSTIVIGTSSSLTKINGNLLINTDTDLVSTVIGNLSSDVYINGYMFTRDISSSGNIKINVSDDDIYDFSLGNLGSTNNIIGTTNLSGNLYFDGNIVINSGDSDNTYINTSNNTGSLFLGNNLNKTEINSSIFSINTNLTSDFKYLNFIDYDSLIANINDINNTSTVVFLATSITTGNDSLTSVQYQTLENIETQKIDVNNLSINFGNTKLINRIFGSNLYLISNELISIKTLSGGYIDIGDNNSSSTITGVVAEINNENDGVIKNTFINNQENSGNVFIGNIQNITEINGSITNINTLSSGSRTIIGHLSSDVVISNLMINGGLTANVNSFDISNINADFLNVSDTTSLNGDIFINGTLECSGNSSFNNDVFFNDSIKVGTFDFQSSIDLDGNQIIKTNSENPALKITQTGNGNLLLIENEIDDTTPFIITSSSDVGIGTLTPNNKLTVVGSISSTDTVYCNLIDLSSVKFTNEYYTATKNITSSNEFIKIIVNGNTKYLRLFDID
jgi:hypothetical protein